MAGTPPACHQHVPPHPTQFLYTCPADIVHPMKMTSKPATPVHTSHLLHGVVIVHTEGAPAGLHQRIFDGIREGSLEERQLRNRLLAHQGTADLCVKSVEKSGFAAK